MTKEQALSILDQVKEDTYPHPTRDEYYKNRECFDVKVFQAWAMDELISRIKKSESWMDLDNVLERFRKEMDDFCCFSKTTIQKTIFTCAVDVVEDVVNAFIDVKIKKGRPV